MALYIHQFIYQIGFWFTWLLIPIVVEILPATSMLFGSNVPSNQVRRTKCL